MPRETAEAPDGLIGRARELSVLRDLLDRLPREGGALVVRGDAGIGKTVLLADAAARAKASGFQVLTAAGVQSETHLPFAGLHQLLRPTHWDSDALPGPQRDALRVAFGRSAAGPPDLFLIALATLDLLANVAEPLPLVVITEDAQWLDRPTSDVLTFVARRVESDPIVMLFGVRDGCQTSLLEAGLLELRVGRLDMAASEALLDSAATGLAPEVRQRLLDEADGNPLALRELPAALASDIARRGETLPSVLPLTARLERAFSLRALELPPDTQTALLVAAIDDESGLAEILSCASLIAKHEVTVGDFTAAIAAGLVEVVQTEVRFHHPLVRSALQQVASAADRQAVHTALASLLIEKPDRRAWHRAAAVGGPDEEVASELAEAAVRAQSRGAPLVAVSALERAAALSPDRTRRGQRLLRAAELAFELGRRDNVARLVREAEPYTTGELEQLRITWIHGISGSAVFDTARVKQLVEAADNARRVGDGDLAWNILSLVAQRCWWSDPGWEAREHVVAAAERAGAVENDPRALAILAYAAPIERGSVVKKWLDGAPSSAETNAEMARAYGSAAVVIGSFELAPRFLATAVDGLRSQGRLGNLARLLVIQSWDATCLGEWPAALSIADEAERLAAETSEPVWAAGAQAEKAVLAALRGQFQLSATLAASAERVLVPTGTNFLFAIVQMARAQAALGEGRPTEAYEQLRRMLEPTDPAYHPVISQWVIADFAEAAAHSEQVVGARTLLHKLDSTISRSSSSWTRTQARYANAVLADDDVAEPIYQAALGAETVRWPFVRGRVLLSYGAWLRRQRRVADSRAPLRAARDAFDALGASAWAERARQELRASGESSPRRATEARERLSPQETQIATMAAQGLPNRVIAQKLYLSHRTVGSHLYRIFPKLGITSRAQLSGVLATR